MTTEDTTKTGNEGYLVQYGWAIVGKFGAYTGWWLTRSEAVEFHIKSVGKTWKKCLSVGDRAVKIKIYYPLV